MNIKELQEKRNNLLATAKTKLEEAGKALSNSDNDAATALQAEVNGYKSQIVVIDEQINTFKTLASMEPEPEAPKEEKVAKAIRPPFAEEGSAPDQPETEEDRRKSVLKSIYTLKYGDIDAATKAVATDLYGADYNQKRFDQQQSFLKYVRHGERRLDRNEEALLKTLILTPEQVANDIKMDTSFGSMKATLNETVNELGGFLVPEDYRVSIVQKIADTGIVRRFAQVQQTSRDSIEWPKLLGGDNRYTSAVRVTWIEENPSDANKSLTNPTFGMVKIPVHTVMSRIDLSKNQLEDSAFNMIGMMTDLFGEASGIDEDVQFTSGTGGDAPKGILGERSGAAFVPQTGIETVATGASSTMQADGVIDLVYSLPQQYRRGAVLMANRTLHRTLRKFKDTTNQYLWEPSYQAGEPARLLGYEFYENESMPDVAVNAYPILFGDFSGYVIVDRIGMTVQRVEDATTAGQNKVALFMRRRLGGDVIEPWKFKSQKVSA